METGGGRDGEGGSRRKEKGEKRKVPSLSLPTPIPSLFFFLFILLGPFPTIRTLSVARLSVSAHEQKRRACTEKASERKRAGRRGF